MDPAEPPDVAKRQGLVVVRRELAELVGSNHLRAQLAAKRWRNASATVVVMHNGPLTAEQQQWVAVLTAGPDAALAGRTSLQMAGLKRWEDAAVHILVPVGHRTTRVPDVSVVFHQSRTLCRTDVISLGAPRTRVARSTIDAASWCRSPRSAAGLITAVCQQGLATPEQLAEALRRAGPIRHAPLLRQTVDDIAGGAQALSEIDFGKLCRAHALPKPERQVLRIDASGRRRYLDAVLTGPDGRKVGVEIDGAHHMDAAQWDRDLDRANDLFDGTMPILRFTSTTIRLDPDRVARQLKRALGLP